MKEYVKILLQRREEILKEQNKLTLEYKAIGDAITDLYNYEQKEKKKKKREKDEREM